MQNGSVAVGAAAALALHAGTATPSSALAYPVLHPGIALFLAALSSHAAATAERPALATVAAGAGGVVAVGADAMPPLPKVTNDLAGVLSGVSTPALRAAVVRVLANSGHALLRSASVDPRAASDAAITAGVTAVEVAIARAVAEVQQRTGGGSDDADGATDAATLAAAVVAIRDSAAEAAEAAAEALRSPALSDRDFCAAPHAALLRRLLLLSVLPPRAAADAADALWRRQLAVLRREQDDARKEAAAGASDAESSSPRLGKKGASGARVVEKGEHSAYADSIAAAAATTTAADSVLGAVFTDSLTASLSASYVALGGGKPSAPPAPTDSDWVAAVMGSSLIGLGATHVDTKEHAVPRGDSASTATLSPRLVDAIVSALGTEVEPPSAAVAVEVEAPNPTAAVAAATSANTDFQLRAALRLTPGSEDAFYTALAISRAAATAAAALGCGDQPSTPDSESAGTVATNSGAAAGVPAVALEALLYGALRHWNAESVGMTAAAKHSCARLMPFDTFRANKVTARRQQTISSSGQSDEISGEGGALALSSATASQARPLGAIRTPKFAIPTSTATRPAAALAAALPRAVLWSLLPAVALPQDGVSSDGADNAGTAQWRVAPALRPPPWGGHSLAALEARATYNTKRLQLGRSRIEGTGLFASEPIHMDDIVGKSARTRAGRLTDARWVMRYIYLPPHSILQLNTPASSWTMRCARPARSTMRAMALLVRCVYVRMRSHTSTPHSCASAITMTRNDFSAPTVPHM